MQKFKIIIFSLILFTIPMMVKAATGSINVSGTSSAIVGNKVSITVVLSSNTAIGSWEMELNYDRNYLQLLSSTAEYETRMVNSSNGIKSKSYTFTFKTLKSGTTRVSVPSYDVYAYDDMSNMTINSSSKSIKLMTQAEYNNSLSKDNNLKNIEVVGFTLNEEFKSDVLEYSLNVPTGTTSVKVIASKSDNKASVSGSGVIDVSEGLNTASIRVVAENGEEKIYTLTINVEDQNPISVDINNKNYVVVKNSALLEVPSTFTSTTIYISDYEVPAFINEVANITLVGLKDELGNIIYVQYSDGKYSLYNNISVDNLLLVPVSLDNNLNLIITSIDINGEKIEAYKYDEDSSLVIINAKNLVNGKTNLYLYDTKNNNAIIYDYKYTEKINEKINNYQNFIKILGGVICLFFLFVIILIFKLRKNSKKIRDFVKKYESKLNSNKDKKRTKKEKKSEIVKEGGDEET